MKKLVSLALASAMSLTLLAGCGGDKPTNTPGSGESNAPAAQNTSLSVSISSEPQTLDPALNSSLDGGTMAMHLFEGLLKWADSGELIDGVDNATNAVLVNGQAETYEKTDNGDGTVTYTFTLRDGIKWSDGQAVTANDFVYAWRRLVDPATAADYGYMLNMVKGYEAISTNEAAADTLGVSAPDDKTFVVELTYDCPYFLEICAFPSTLPIREDVVSADPDGWTHSPETYLSNGAYKLTKWEHNAEIVMEKNAEYYDVANIGPDAITFKLMDNDNAILTSFNSGELEFIQTVPVDEIPGLLINGELDIIPYIGTYYVSFNTQDEIFKDPRIRKAFTLAIDSQYIVENVTQTGQVPATGFVPSGVADAEPGSDFRAVGGDYWTAPTTAEQYEANVAEARELMAEAGYPNGEGFPTITYTYNTVDSHKKIGEALQQQWQKALGVNVKLENQDWSVFLQSRKDGNYQIARNGWIADYNDPISFLDMLVTGGGNNDEQYSNPAYDAAIAKAQSTSDPAERMAAMHEAEDILIGQDWVLAPIYFQTQKYMVKDNLQGLYYTPLGFFFFDHITKG